MATEQEFVNYKDFVESLDSVDPSAGDKTVLNVGGTGPKSSVFSAIAAFVHNTFAAFVNALTAKTSFASGDKIPVVNGSTATAMAASKLLELTAQNTLAGNVAQAFDPTRDEENPYLAGESVIYEGKKYTFKVDHYGAWNAADVVSFADVMYMLAVDSEGIIPFNQRLNGKLGTNWALFNSATTQNIDDYVSVTTANVGYSGIRNASLLSYLGANKIKQGDKFYVCFLARLHTGSSATIKMFLGGSVSPQNRDVELTSSWNLYIFEVTFSSGAEDVKWLQFSTTGTAQTIVFDIRSVVVFASNSILGRLYQLENDSTLSQAIATTASNFAGKFLATKDYFKHQIVINENKLYQFKANHPAGAWASSDVKEFSFEKFLEGVVAFGLRLDGNLPSSWYAFNNSTLSAVDDYVKVVTASQSYSGIRNDSWRSWFSTYGAAVGEKFLLSFWARNEADAEKTLGVYVGYGTAPQNKQFTIDGKWRLYTFEIEYVVDDINFNRLQIGNPNVAQAVTFDIKDVEVYPLNSLFAKEKLAEKQIQDFPIPTHTLNEKKLAVIGDSISTIYNGNTPYWTVKDVDVGNEIEAYVSWFDIYTSANDTTQVTNKTIGGVTLTAAMIGTKQTFTPVAGDVGKTIGDAYNYNPSGVKTWSQVLAEKTGATLIANASFSGASMCDGQASYLTNTHGFSPYTIGRCRVRDDAGNFVNPDAIFIYRGTNDMTHGQGGQGYSVLDDYDLMENGYPESDVNASGKYSFRRAYYMTIKALREAYPKAMIYCCTLNVFKRIIYDRYPTRNGLYSLPQMNKVIREIAAEMGCGLVDFERDGITFENCYSEGYITDSATTPTHPNNKGHGVMGDRATIDAVFIN